MNPNWCSCINSSFLESGWFSQVRLLVFRGSKAYRIVRDRLLCFASWFRDPNYSRGTLQPVERFQVITIHCEVWNPAGGRELFDDFHFSGSFWGFKFFEFFRYITGSYRRCSLFQKSLGKLICVDCRVEDLVGAGGGWLAKARSAIRMIITGSSAPGRTDHKGTMSTVPFDTEGSDAWKKKSVLFIKKKSFTSVFFLLSRYINCRPSENQNLLLKKMDKDQLPVPN